MNRLPAETEDKRLGFLIPILEEACASFKILGTEKVWWRGHSDKDYRLQPMILRGKYRDHDEYNLITQFEQEAPIRYADWPESRDKRLLLMQHYGLPTRLLDWSRSLLAGLYFALRNKDHDDRDGCLWALSPNRLNLSQVGNNAIFTTESPEVKKRIDDAFTRPEERTRVEGVLATIGPQIDLRMLVQLSCFTIHATGTSPIEELGMHQDFVSPVVVPQESKPYLRQMVGILGTLESQLFPDLGSLASFLKGNKDFYSIKPPLEETGTEPESE